MTARLRAVIDRRRVLALLARRDLKVKYGSSVLGYGWSLLEPLMLTAIYYFVFTRIARFGIENYGLFLVCVLLPWLWANASVSDSTRAMTSQAKLLTTMNLPREIFPLAVVSGKFVEYVVTLPVLAAFAVLAGVAPSRFLLALPLAILIQTLLLTGLALFLAAVNTLVRDVQRAIRVALRAVFYLSPVVYPLTMVPGSIRPSYELNPLVGIFSLHRAVWFPETFPGWRLVVESATVSLAVFAAGWLVFARLERVVLKEL